MRIFKGILIGVVAIILIFVLMLFVVGPITWHWRVRQESIAALSAADGTNALQQAVGGLGIFIPLRDGSWIAIRYRDTHSGMLESLSVARDSEGSWFESRHHFCGAFAAYRHQRRQMEALGAELARLGETDTNVSTSARSETAIALDAVHLASSLEDARQQLYELGFRSIEK